MGFFQFYFVISTLKFYHNKGYTNPETNLETQRKFISKSGKLYS